MTRSLRRMVVTLLGGTVLIIGLALLVLSGPAVVVIPLGLAILASEWPWARRWFNQARQALRHHRGKLLCKNAA